MPPAIRAAAPTLGQHNAEVLRELLGLSEAEIKALQDDGVIGTVATSKATGGAKGG
jgi:crotonobetainyl-CoA:carnitine CoA-transferase CaiB-like acyl-CoA transferase